MASDHMLFIFGNYFMKTNTDINLRCGQKSMNQHCIYDLCIRHLIMTAACEA